MKRFVPISIILVLFAFLGLSCYPANQQAQEPAESALTTRISALESRLATAEGTIAALNARPSGGVSEETVNAKIQAVKDTYLTVATYNADMVTLDKRIDAIEASGSNSPSSTTTPTTPATNQITAKIYNISPSMVYAAGIYDIFVEIKNGYADAKKIVLAVTLTPDVSSTRICSSCSLPLTAVCCGNISPCPTCAATKFWSDSVYITGSGDKLATSVSAGDCINYTSLIMGTTNQILISGNGGILVPVKFQLTYCGGSTTAIWSPICSVTVIP